MKWQLTEPHHIDEQVLPAGTIIGDDTPWKFRSTYNDPKIGRKIGDALPPSRAMRPIDQEAHDAFNKEFGGVEPQADPTRSIPLTGAENAPRVPGVGAPQHPHPQEPVNRPPVESSAKPTGMAMQRPNPSPSTPEPPAKPELKTPPGHDSAKNPGDSKETETAKAPDIKKL